MGGRFVSRAMHGQKRVRTRASSSVSKRPSAARRNYCARAAKGLGKAARAAQAAEELRKAAKDASDLAAARDLAQVYGDPPPSPAAAHGASSAGRQPYMFSCSMCGKPRSAMNHQCRKTDLEFVCNAEAPAPKAAARAPPASAPARAAKAKAAPAAPSKSKSGGVKFGA